MCIFHTRLLLIANNWRQTLLVRIISRLPQAVKQSSHKLLRNSPTLSTEHYGSSLFSLAKLHLASLLANPHPFRAFSFDVLEQTW